MKQYLNRDWLYQMYITNDLSQKTIGKICNVNQATIHKYLVRFDIPRRKWCGRSGIHCHLWKGGKMRTYKGYIHILDKKHPRAMKNGYAPEQVLVVEKHLKRFLVREEAVHHINGIKDDNRIENLYLFPNEAEHQRYHRNLTLKNTLPITMSNLL